MIYTNLQSRYHRRLGVVLLMSVLFAGCADRDTFLSGQVGKTCKVQFKRNALGGGASLPVPPTTDSINGADVSLSGTLQTVESSGIVISSGEKKFWIPRDAILLIEIGK